MSIKIYFGFIITIILIYYYIIIRADIVKTNFFQHGAQLNLQLSIFLFFLVIFYLYKFFSGRCTVQT